MSISESEAIARKLAFIFADKPVEAPEQDSWYTTHVTLKVDGEETVSQILVALRKEKVIREGNILGVAFKNREVPIDPLAPEEGKILQKYARFVETPNRDPDVILKNGRMFINTAALDEDKINKLVKKAVKRLSNDVLLGAYRRAETSILKLAGTDTASLKDSFKKAADAKKLRAEPEKLAEIKDPSLIQRFRYAGWVACQHTGIDEILDKKQLRIVKNAGMHIAAQYYARAKVPKAAKAS